MYIVGALIFDFTMRGEKEQYKDCIIRVYMKIEREVKCVSITCLSFVWDITSNDICKSLSHLYSSLL